jgi:hypothetical protein
METEVHWRIYNSNHGFLFSASLSPYFLNTDFNITLHLSLGLPSSLFPSHFPKKLYTYFSSPPWLLHAPPALDLITLKYLVNSTNYKPHYETFSSILSLQTSQVQILFSGRRYKLTADRNTTIYTNKIFTGGLLKLLSRVWKVRSSNFNWPFNITEVYLNSSQALQISDYVLKYATTSSFSRFTIISPHLIWIIYLWPKYFTQRRKVNEQLLIFSSARLRIKVHICQAERNKLNFLLAARWKVSLSAVNVTSVAHTSRRDGQDASRVTQWVHIDIMLNVLMPPWQRLVVSFGK